MAKQNLDMAKFTKRQRYKAASLEEGLRKQGVAPREAEEQAWKEASQAGGGKRRKDHSYGGRGKINSSSSPKSRKTHVGGPESSSRGRAGRGIGSASGKER
jgi:hypothetical protein